MSKVPFPAVPKQGHPYQDRIFTTPTKPRGYQNAQGTSLTALLCESLSPHHPTITTTKVLVVKIVDLFDFSGSWIENFRDIIGANPIVLVANKVDLLPAGIAQEAVWFCFSIPPPTHFK